MLVIKKLFEIYKTYLKIILSFLLITLLINITGCTFKNNDDIEKNYIKDVLVVNKKYSLGKDYIPENLIVPKVQIYKGVSDEEKQVEKCVEQPLIELFNAAAKSGNNLYILSAYRSYNTQKDIYSTKKKENGSKYAKAYVANPGESEHQSGLAIDVTNSSEKFSGSKEAKWLEKNCYLYGFILRYPKDKEKSTGYNYEPWHIRYVGKDIAKKIHDENLSLEEYLEI